MANESAKSMANVKKDKTSQMTDLCTSLHNHCHPLGIASTSCYQSPVDNMAYSHSKSIGFCDLHPKRISIVVSCYETRRFICSDCKLYKSVGIDFKRETHLSPSSACSLCAAWLSSRMPAYGQLLLCL